MSKKKKPTAPKPQIFRSPETGKWHARIVAHNGQIVWSTEADGYTRKRSAIRAIELLQEVDFSQTEEIV
jgi:uncharacterized protein YegP (UPF0339 family)